MQTQKYLSCDEYENIEQQLQKEIDILLEQKYQEQNLTENIKITLLLTKLYKKKIEILDEHLDLHKMMKIQPIDGYKYVNTGKNALYKFQSDLLEQVQENKGNNKKIDVFSQYI